MKKFKVPVTWEVYATIEVEAETLEEAMKIAKDEDGEIPLPTQTEYVDGSWRVNVDSPEELALYNQNN